MCLRSNWTDTFLNLLGLKVFLTPNVTYILCGDLANVLKMENILTFGNVAYIVSPSVKRLMGKAPSDDIKGLGKSN